MKVFTEGVRRLGWDMAGGSKLVPFKIMPDPDDSQRFVIARHDWEKDELVPQMRRGVKRYVERNREGTWNLVKE